MLLIFFLWYHNELFRGEKTDTDKFFFSFFHLKNNYINSIKIIIKNRKI